MTATLYISIPKAGQILNIYNTKTVPNHKIAQSQMLHSGPVLMHNFLEGEKKAVNLKSAGPAILFHHLLHDCSLMVPLITILNKKSKDIVFLRIHKYHETLSRLYTERVHCLLEDSQQTLYKKKKASLKTLREQQDYITMYKGCKLLSFLG